MQDPYSRSTTAESEAAIMRPMHKTMNTIKVDKDHDIVEKHHDKNVNKEDCPNDYVSWNNKNFKTFAKEQCSNMEMNLKKEYLEQSHESIIDKKNSDITEDTELFWKASSR